MIRQLKEYYKTPEGRERILLLLIVAINLALKLIPAGLLDLGNDEVYYWTYAMFPDWSHFDHPPLVGLTIQLFTANLKFTSEFMFRSGALILSSLNIVILYFLVKKIYSQRAAFIAVLLFTSSFYFNIICGLFILPDTPQIFFVLLALYFGLPAVIKKEPLASDGYLIIAFGIFTGLAFLSKYHALFLWLGFGLYVLFRNRQWLRKPSFYISILLTLILMIPVFYWNMKNNFVSFTFHEGRIGLFHSSINPGSFLQFNAGEFFYQNPVVFVVCLLALAAVFRKRKEKIKDVKMLLIYLSLPLILIFTLFSLFKSTLPHWSGPAFICLIILSSEWLSGLYARRRRRVINTLLAANLLFIVILIAGTVQVKYGGILPADNESDPSRLGSKDITLDMYGWKQARVKFISFLQEEQKRNGDDRKVKIISDKWFPAAHIDFYIAHPLKIDLLVFGDLAAAHKYFWINKTRKISPDDRIYFITSSQHYFDPGKLSDYFSGIIPRDTIPIIRSGTRVENLFIYEMTGLKSDSIAKFR